MYCTEGFQTSKDMFQIQELSVSGNRLHYVRQNETTWKGNSWSPPGIWIRRNEHKETNWKQQELRIMQTLGWELRVTWITWTVPDRTTSTTNQFTPAHLIISLSARRNSEVNLDGCYNPLLKASTKRNSNSGMVSKAVFPQSSVPLCALRCHLE